MSVVSRLLRGIIADEMELGIFSDIHDHVWNLAAALPALAGRDVLLCCGDLRSPFVIHQLGRGFGGPIHIVFGNNGADLYRIAAAMYDTASGRAEQVMWDSNGADWPSGTP